MAVGAVALRCPFPLPSLQFPVWPIDSPEGLFPALNSMTAQGPSTSKGPKAGLSLNEVVVLPRVLPAQSMAVSERVRRETP